MRRVGGIVCDEVTHSLCIWEGNRAQVSAEHTQRCMHDNQAPIPNKQHAH